MIKAINLFYYLYYNTNVPYKKIYSKQIKKSRLNAVCIMYNNND